MKGNSRDTTIRRRRTHKQPMTHINLWIPDGQLALLDAAAAQDSSNRSELIRTAVM